MQRRALSIFLYVREFPVRLIKEAYRENEVKQESNRISLSAMIGELKVLLFIISFYSSSVFPLKAINALLSANNMVLLQQKRFLGCAYCINAS